MTDRPPLKPYAEKALPSKVAIWASVVAFAIVVLSGALWLGSVALKAAS